MYLRSRNGFEWFFGSHFLHSRIVFFLIFRHEHFERTTGFLLLLIKVINNNSNKEVECEEGAKDDEEYKIEIHVDVDLSFWLLINLLRFVTLITDTALGTGKII